MTDDCIGCNTDHQSGYLCPSCREALEVGKRILGLIEEQKAGMPCGSEVDRLKVLLWQIDRRMMDVLKERYKAMEGLHKISKLYYDGNTDRENAMDAYDAKMIAINTLKGEVI